MCFCKRAQLFELKWIFYCR